MGRAGAQVLVDQRMMVTCNRRYPTMIPSAAAIKTVPSSRARAFHGFLATPRLPLRSEWMRAEPSPAAAPLCEWRAARALSGGHRAPIFGTLHPYSPRAQGWLG